MKKTKMIRNFMDRVGSVLPVRVGRRLRRVASHTKGTCHTANDWVEKFAKSNESATNVAMQAFGFADDTTDAIESPCVRDWSASLDQESTTEYLQIYVQRRKE